MEKIDLLKKIIEAVGTTFDLDSVLNIICIELQQAFQVDRVGIARYVPEYDEWIIQAAYMTAPNIPSIKDAHFSHKFKLYIRKVLLKRGKDMVIDNLKESDLPDYIIEEYEQLGIKSVLNVSIKKGNNKWGILGLFQNSCYKHWTQEEIELLHTIIDYIYVAIKQAELFSITKQQSEREKILRETIEVLRSTLDPMEIKQQFIEITSRYFDADRCLFDDYDKQTNKFFPFRIERLKSPEIKSFVGINLENEFPEFTAKLKKGKNVIVKDVEKTYLRKKLTGYKALEFLHENGVKSDYGLSVKYKGELYGILIIHFTIQKRILNHEELAFLKVLKDQVGIALYQVELYNTVKQTAEREALLRRITGKIRSSLDINETLEFICDEVAKLFNVQRATITEFPDPDNYENYIIRREYSISPEIKGLSSVEYDHRAAVYWANNCLKKEKCLTIDNIPESDTPDYFKDNYIKLGVKSMIGFPIRRDGDKWGMLVLSEYNYYRHWNKEEASLLGSIADQTFIAIKQAELYNTVKQTAEREALSRRVTETIRSSLDIKEIKKNIVNEIGKTFKADRCYFRTYDKKRNLFLVPDAEYLSSPNIESMTDIEPDQTGLRYFSDELMKRKKGTYPIVIDADFAKKNKYIQRYLESTHIKAVYTAPVWDKEDELIYLALHYIKKDPKLDEDDKRLLETLASQTAVAIDHAKLFSETQEAKNREILLKTIINEILTSKNIDEAYYRIDAKLAEIFNVDRTALSLYDPILKIFLGLIGEYRVNKNVPSARNITNPFTEEINKILNDELVDKKRVFIIENVDNSKYSATLKEQLNSVGAKSTAWMPIIYKDNIIAAIFLTNTESYKIWTESEINLLDSITRQIAIGINLFKFADESNRLLTTERTLRDLVTVTRHSESHDQLYSYVLENILQIFNVDRAMHLHYCTTGDVSIINEYIKEGLTSLKNEIIFTKENTRELVSNAFNKAIIINDVNKDIQDTELKDYLLNNNITAFVIYPVTTNTGKTEQTFGAAMICSKSPRIWTSNEIETLKLILDTTILVYQEIKQRKEVEQVKQTFLATLTHDLRSPITAEQKALEAILSKK
ncbi:MAG: GAF domain-containing protein, partial [Candidatus Gastranaerophilales bacterium]|nr:GAF domain-containing protein [Candidatus Gastranaerophilales bacterium]